MIRKELDDITCIGTSNGIDVNVYYTTHWREGDPVRIPCVEVRRMGSIQMRLPEVEAVIDLLQEALAHWQEEGE